MGCPYCESINTYQFFKSNIPNILSACTEHIAQNVKDYKIEVSLCKDCGLGFNSLPLGESELKYIYDNYLYISPKAGIGTSKYEGMINTIEKYVDKNAKVVEIGCSEGYLLEKLREKGYTNLIGIEPGPQADCARNNGFEIIKDYFTEYTFDETDKINTFYLMHVFEHFSDPFKILDSMNDVLDENGYIIIEVPDFGGFHHQHLFYYSKFFFNRLAKDKNLQIEDVEISMSAIRVVLSKRNKATINETNINEVYERAQNIESNFNKAISNIRNFISKVERENAILYWWGSGSATVIIMNHLKETIKRINKTIVIDGDPGKWNLIIPGINFKVDSYRHLENKDIEYLIIGSSFEKEIKKTLEDYSIRAKNVFVLDTF